MVRLNMRVIYLLLLFINLQISAKTYTLDYCISAVLKNAIDLQVAKIEIENSELMLQSVYGRLLPSVSMGLYTGRMYGYYVPPFMVDACHVPFASRGENDNRNLTRDHGLGVALPKKTSIGEAENATIFPTDVMKTALVLRQSVFMQGKTVPSLTMAKSAQGIAVCRFEEMKQEIIGETIKKYYTVLIEQHRVSLQRKQKEIIEENHRFTKIKYSLALSEEVDTLESMLLLEEAIVDLKQAESGFDKAAEALIAQCRIAESPSRLLIEDELPEPVFFISIEEALAQLHATNYTIKQFKGYEHIGAMSIKLARADYLPNVYIGAVIGKTGEMTKNGNNFDIDFINEHRLFAGLSWNLFTGLSTTREIERQKNRQEVLLLHQQKIIDSLEFETRSLHADIMIMIEKLQVFKRIVELSEKRRKALNVAYTNNIETEYQLNKADLELKRAELKYNEQLYLFHCAVINFRLLIGEHNSY